MLGTEEKPLEVTLSLRTPEPALKAIAGFLRGGGVKGNLSGYCLVCCLFLL